MDYQNEQIQTADIVNETVRQPISVDKQSATVTAKTNDSLLPTDTPKWFYDDGTPGKGERPEWLQEKYGFNVAKQAKGYYDARQELSKVTNELNKYNKIPEKYSVELLPDYKDKVTLPEDDPILSKFSTIAKEAKLSQKQYNDVLNFYVYNAMHQSQESEEQAKIAMENEFKSLGPHAEQIIQDVVAWSKSNIDPEFEDVVNVIGRTAQGVKFLKSLAERSRYTPIPSPVSAASSAEAIHERLKSKISSPQYASNVAYQNEVNEEYRKFYESYPDFVTRRR